MKYLSLFLLLLVNAASWSQTGSYFLSHYAPSDERLEHSCFDMVQDDRGVLYFATRAGILYFDGLNWSEVEGATGAVYALDITTKGDIFWAGTNGFGRIKKALEGTIEAETLSQAGAANVYQILSSNDKVYFLNDNAIFIAEDGQISSLSIEKVDGSFTLLFELFGIPFISTSSSANYKIDQGKLTRSSFNLPENSEIIFSTRFENHYLLGSAEHLYLCSEDLKVREVVMENSEDKDYIRASVITNATWVNRHLVALGTLRGGVIFINPFTGKMQQIIDYNAGLPDNEIFALMYDNNKNIWAAHDYGFTRISPFFPFRSFSHYNGLLGNVLCARTFNTDVYVGTSLGLFKLVREDVYEEMTYYVTVKEEQPPQKEADESVKPAEKKKGFLGFLKRRSRDETINEDKDAQENKKGSPALEEVEKVKRVRKTEKILRSSYYAYKKVNGIEAKVTHLAEFNGKLIASGLAGVFEIKDLQATVVFEEPARFLFSYQDKFLALSTYSGDVHLLQYQKEKWKETKPLDQINDDISFMFGGDDEIWLCALTETYRISIENGTWNEVQRVELPNPNSSKVAGLQWDNNIIVVNAEGFFRFDRNNTTFTKIDSLPKPRLYFASDANLWYHDSHYWKVFGKSAAKSNIYLLNIFPELRFIASDVESNNMWLVTGQNELYRFFGETLSINETQYPLFIKQITLADKRISSGKIIRIIQEEGTLTVEVVKPDFIGTKLPEYRYFLKGLNDEWSEWSQNLNKLSFPYLPNGTYTLLAESRDAFGATSTLTPVEIEVLPPYWRRPWFYAMEFSIFAMLVMLSFRLSVRYRVISRILSLLTIILLIEFIQTVAGYTFSTNSSPVIDFIIQVLVACMVLPIEGYLRNLMLKSMNSENRFYKIISGTPRFPGAKNDLFNKQ